MVKGKERKPWGSFFLEFISPHDSESTSPEISRSRPPVEEAPPVEAREAPPAPLPVPVESGPRPRQLLIRGTRLYEVAEDGSIWLAADDGHHEESLLAKWKRMRNSEINFE
jgi:hypothetical protein